MSEKLSDHFTLGECCRSETAQRHGIDNTATGEELENLKRVLENVIEPVRVNFGIPFIYIFFTIIFINFLYKTVWNIYI